MKKNLFTLLIFCYLSLTVHAQSYEIYKGDTTNKIDIDGRKQGKWVLLGKHKSGTCYSPEAKVEEGRYQDNRKKDIWIEYYCNGNMKHKLTFTNGKPDGYAQMFHENGKIREEGQWKNDRWIGKYKLYYENGQVQHEFSFNPNGKLEGSQKYFYDNGQIAIEGNFANGKEAGLIKEYYENGDIKAEKNFSNGNVGEVKEYQPKKPMPPKSQNPSENAPKLVVKPDELPNEGQSANKEPIVLNGLNTLYNKNKQITKDGIFKNNVFMDGKAYFYNENGILTRVAVYKNGIYVGDTPAEK